VGAGTFCISLNAENHKQVKNRVILEALFLFLVLLLTAYLVRHYVFTLTVLYRRKKPTYNDYEKSFQPKVSILIPAKNEERVIDRILQRMCELTYPKEKLEIIVIDDASTDRTGEIAETFARNYAFIQVIHRDSTNGGRGKPKALNEGLIHASGEIIYCFDADYYPQQDILERFNAYFRDAKVGAVQGRVTVLNEPVSLVTRLVALERIAGYRVDQKAREELGLIPQYGGTVGGFRSELIRALGGWDQTILAEDTDLTFRCYLAGYKVRYVNEAESYEEAVEDWRSYWLQRSRWAKGHMQCAFKHLLQFVKCANLSFGEKLDGLLLLNVYFLPIIVLLAWIVGVALYFAGSSVWFSSLWALVPLSLYSAVGNFAPFFEIGIGAYLDERTRIYWLIPLLFVTFFINIAICTKVFLELCASKVSGKRQFEWKKTTHNGYGNHYIDCSPKQ
jgi:cellulose synthase/poly-beta-1,6-N-acetylglucosamine synthase-like glycosyltransferase